MLDDTLLDDPAALQRADQDRALLALAGAGARVRTALRQADAAGLDRLRPDGRPRAVLVAGHGSALTAAEMLAALAGTASLVVPLPPSEAVAPRADRAGAPPAFTSGLGWQLPGWAGPLDLLVISSADGGEQGLVGLAEQAYARGCAIVVTAPAGSALAEAALQVRALPLPYVTSVLPEDGPPVAAAEPDLPAEDPAALWSHLTPLLALAQKIGLTQLPYDALAGVADLLDATAVRCAPTRPRTPTRRRAWPRGWPGPSRCCGPRARSPGRPPTASPPSWPTGPGGRRWPGNCRRCSPPTGACSPGSWARARTRTTSSATGSRSRTHCTSRCCCCGTFRVRPDRRRSRTARPRCRRRTPARAASA